MATLSDLEPARPSGHRPGLRYRRRYLRCDVDAADRERLVAAVAQLPDAMGGRLHTLDIKPIKNVRDRGDDDVMLGGWDAHRRVFPALEPVRVEAA